VWQEHATNASGRCPGMSWAMARKNKESSSLSRLEIT